jgi:FtsX-like permease family protein
VTTFRRLAFPLWLARTRLARRGGRLGVVVLGLGAASAMLAAVLAGTVAAEDRAVGRTIVVLKPDVRAVRVNWFSVGGQAAPYATLDAHVRGELRHVAAARPIGTSLYRQSTLGGAYLGLGAADDLGRWVRLRSGRLPRVCSPSRCEVLVIRRGGRIPNVAGLRLVAVGEGDLRSATLFGDAVPVAGQLQSDFIQAMVRYHRPAPPPLVLASGVAALDRLPRLHDTYRSYGWVLPLNRALVRSWAVRALATRIETVRSELQAEPFGFALRAPTEELRAAADSSRVAGRRLFLLGGEAVALLLAFAVLVAARLRRDVDAARERLVSSGVRRWQVEAEVVAESAAMAVTGTLVGWLVGVGVAVALAGRAGEPVGALVRHSLLSGRGIAVALLLAAAASAVLVAALTIRPISVGRVSFSPLDAAALGAAAVVAVALARGAADPEALLAGNGTGVVLLLLPALVGFAAAVAVARLLPAGLRLLERAVPRGALAFRLAALALARRPGYAVVAVGFVAVSIGLALFAETYRWTLVRGERDQAAFAVPADYVVREDLSQLIPVAAAVTPSVLESFPRALRVEPVTRQNGSIQGAADVSGVAVLGIGARSLPRIDGWRSDFASASLPELARRLDPGPVGLRGAALPLAATSLELPARVSGTEVGVVVSIRGRDGSFTALRLGETRDSRRVTLSAAIPAAARGGKLVAFRFEPPPKLEERGADTGAPATGSVTLGRPVAVTPSGRVGVSDYGDWIGTTGVGRVARRGGMRFDLTLTNEVDTYVRPRQPTDGLRIPAVVSPRMAELAGRDGLLGIDVAGHSLVFRVAAVARRFPGTASPETADFVVADRPALVTALNASAPGAGFATELWLSAPSSERRAVETRLDRPPFTVLDVASQSRLERELRTEPVARAAVAMLEAAAVTALVLALLGLLLGVVAERRDEGAELFDLEAQGMSPAQLRRQLRLRALVVGLTGVLGGILTGLVLSLLVVGFVELTANATAPNPPLVLSLDWTVVAVAAVAAGAAGILVVVLATGRAFRQATPARYGEGGA